MMSARQQLSQQQRRRMDFCRLLVALGGSACAGRCKRTHHCAAAASVVQPASCASGNFFPRRRLPAPLHPDERHPWHVNGRLHARLCSLAEDKAPGRHPRCCSSSINNGSMNKGLRGLDTQRGQRRGEAGCCLRETDRRGVACDACASCKNPAGATTLLYPSNRLPAQLTLDPLQHAPSLLPPCRLISSRPSGGDGDAQLRRERCEQRHDLCRHLAL